MFIYKLKNMRNNSLAAHAGFFKKINQKRYYGRNYITFVIPDRVTKLGTIKAHVLN